LGSKLTRGALECISVSEKGNTLRRERERDMKKEEEKEYYRGAKRRREAIPKRRTTGCKGPGLGHNSNYRSFI